MNRPITTQWVDHANAVPTYDKEVLKKEIAKALQGQVRYFHGMEAMIEKMASTPRGNIINIIKFNLVSTFTPATDGVQTFVKGKQPTRESLIKHDQKTDKELTLKETFKKYQGADSDFTKAATRSADYQIATGKTHFELGQLQNQLQMTDNEEHRNDIKDRMLVLEKALRTLEESIQQLESDIEENQLYMRKLLEPLSDKQRNDVISGFVPLRDDREQEKIVTNNTDIDTDAPMNADFLYQPYQPLGGSIEAESTGATRVDSKAKGPQMQWGGLPPYNTTVY